MIFAKVHLYSLNNEGNSHRSSIAVNRINENIEKMEE